MEIRALAQYNPIIPIFKEIYGAGAALNEWTVPILRYALHTNMTLNPNRFKNCSDIALIIGAMDLLVERAARGTAIEPNTTADVVVIASSDSDYSALALRLRTSGIQVIGMGEDGRTNPSWPMACSEFSFLPLWMKRARRIKPIREPTFPYVKRIIKRRHAVSLTAPVAVRSITNT